MKWFVVGLFESSGLNHMKLNYEKKNVGMLWIKKKDWIKVKLYSTSAHFFGT